VVSLVFSFSGRGALTKLDIVHCSSGCNLEVTGTVVHPFSGVSQSNLLPSFLACLQYSFCPVALLGFSVVHGQLVLHASSSLPNNAEYGHGNREVRIKGARGTHMVFMLVLEAMPRGGWLSSKVRDLTWTIKVARIYMSFVLRALFIY
jgi:hypothetical protein